jgi:hypothetical protein
MRAFDNRLLEGLEMDARDTFYFVLGGFTLLGAALFFVWLVS